MESNWSPCLQTLEGHGDVVTSVVFSHDSKLIMSGSFDGTVKVWDAAIGSLQRTLGGDGSGVTSVVFSHDSKLVALGSRNGTVEIWDTAMGFL